MANWRVAITFGLLLAVVALSLVITALATEYWVVIDVNRTAIDNSSTSLSPDPLYFSRHRAVFRTCYYDPAVEPLIQRNPSVITLSSEGPCEDEVGYRMDTASSDGNYLVRNHLLRAQLAFLLLAVLLLFVALIVGVLAACQEAVKMLKATMGLIISSSVSILIGMAFFLGIFYLEENQILDPATFHATWRNDPILEANTTTAFGYSFFIGWGSAFLCIISWILFALSIRWIKSERKAASKQTNMYAYYLHPESTSGTSTKSGRKKNKEVNGTVGRRLSMQASHPTQDGYGLSSDYRFADDEYYNFKMTGKNKAYDLSNKPAHFRAGSFRQGV